MDVVIVGGGISGLTAAALLRHLPLVRSCTVLERDQHDAWRSQGYGLSLRKDLGLSALAAIGINSKEGLGSPVRAFRFYNGDVILLELAPLSERSPHYTEQASRPALHAALADCCKFDTDDRMRRKFDCTAVGYAPGNANGDRATVLLSDGSTLAADLVLACDGSRSKLRAQMHPQSIGSLGITLVTGKASGTHLVSAHVNASSAALAMHPSGHTFFAALSDSTRADLGWSLGVPHTAVQHAALENLSPPERLQYVKTVMSASGWPHCAPDFIAATSVDSLRLVNLRDVPVPHTFVDGRVVLLGDAAHSMTPFRWPWRQHRHGRCSRTCGVSQACCRGGQHPRRCAQDI